MLREILKCKIHRATVTETALHYEGSLSLAADLMESAGLVPFEKIHVVNINNGARFETYVIRAEAGSGAVILNGAAARLAQPGDRVILMAYGYVEEAKLGEHRPTILLVDERNEIVSRH
jgi:aspartate 1-decarboxylase